MARVFSSKYGLLPGTSYDEVVRVARKEYDAARRNVRRQPHVRSKYFRKDKIFIAIFWSHIMQKHRGDRTKRLRLYKASLDLLRNSTEHPETRAFHDVLLHRFYGKTTDGIEFCVQVKEDKRSGRKDFMSVFERKLNK